MLIRAAENGYWQTVRLTVNIPHLSSMKPAWIKLDF